MEDTSALMTTVCGELRRIARARLRGRASGHTLQASALFNEAYLQLAEYP